MKATGYAGGLRERHSRLSAGLVTSRMRRREQRLSIDPRRHAARVLFRLLKQTANLLLLRLEHAELL